MLEIEPLKSGERLMIFIPIILVIAIVSIFVKCGTNKDYYERYLSKDKYNGTITEKFRDYKNHGSGTLILKGNFNQKTEFYADDWVHLWDLCNLGDSLYKKKGELNLHLFRRNEQDTILISFNQNRSGFTFMKRFEKK
jgi:hypothetical protein